VRRLVRRLAEELDEGLATRSPLGAGGGAAFGHRRVGGTGTGQRGPGAGPSLVSPAYQDAKLEDVEGLPVGRLRTARRL
jgi:hypothetical protein